MPTMQPAPNKATTMNKIGYKKTKCNDSVYKTKFKKKLEKKLVDEDSDYEPNRFEAKDSDYEPNVANCKPPPETIAVQENDDLPGKGNDVLDSIDDIGVCHATNTVPDGMQNIPPPPESFAVANFNTNDDHKDIVSSSTFSFVAINYSPKIGGIG